MGYSDDDTMVRVDFFKQSGKWYCTEAVKWTADWRACYTNLIHDAFAKSLRDHLDNRLSEMDAICLEPFHEYSHPVQLKKGSWKNIN